MFQNLGEWLRGHPQVLVIAAAIGVGIAVNNYVDAVQMAKNIEDLRASEMLGG